MINNRMVRSRNTNCRRSTTFKHSSELIGQKNIPPIHCWRTSRVHHRSGICCPQTARMFSTFNQPKLPRNPGENMNHRFIHLRHLWKLGRLRTSVFRFRWSSISARPDLPELVVVLLSTSCVLSDWPILVPGNIVCQPPSFPIQRTRETRYLKRRERLADGNTV